MYSRLRKEKIPMDFFPDKIGNFLYSEATIEKVIPQEHNRNAYAD